MTRQFTFSTHIQDGVKLVTISDADGPIYEGEYSSWMGVDGTKIAVLNKPVNLIDVEALDALFEWGDELARRRNEHEKEVLELDGI